MNDETKAAPKRHVVRKVLFGIVLAFLVIEVIELPFPWTVAWLERNNPKMTAVMKERIRQARAKDEPYKIRQTFVLLSRISHVMVQSVIVGEDGTFYENHGVDWYEAQQSFEENWKEKKIVRGSSTITMQLAKNLWFSTSRDPLTKLNEIICAYMLDYFLTKNRVMELYLNYIEFGRGIFGVESASRTYFNEPASAITRSQAAKLAAIIPSPLKHSPDSPSRFVAFRSNVILARMDARGW